MTLTNKGWALLSGSRQAGCRYTTDRSDKGMSDAVAWVPDKRKDDREEETNERRRE